MNKFWFDFLRVNLNKCMMQWLPLKWKSLVWSKSQLVNFSALGSKLNHPERPVASLGTKLVHLVSNSEPSSCYSLQYIYIRVENVTYRNVLVEKEELHNVSYALIKLLVGKYFQLWRIFLREPCLTWVLVLNIMSPPHDMGEEESSQW